MATEAVFILYAHCLVHPKPILTLVVIEQKEQTWINDALQPMTVWPRLGAGGRRLRENSVSSNRSVAAAL